MATFEPWQTPVTPGRNRNAPYQPSDDTTNYTRISATLGFDSIHQATTLHRVKRYTTPYGSQGDTRIKESRRRFDGFVSQWGS
ncbi:hypothetical protein K0M31_019760 [Melipona bicolor]|uniref:Uncharacterized protein n=1 Tax=Melipona bicolor TaxID=60889 RepID=A0AA40G319_9HYME|nr:hypothetical protein K0M31_019760 [Melipona bicolor]